ncbi:hypothetical protein UAW_01804 [Enterococcus haemoperoxidus ATCC BAA-382]|uniref:Uncharacterized protein n=1 Tax=Enterococcus haemoperoxidus ATCC BAA-382 TaxID=1158608 RepID=R2T8T0_9ENTE|nr:DUF916 and DUF3324 domain-containing protein [Enterococcus haemoperoxidus]EOH96639.1 hypothetical protein UAW_01804 [Enterococcus haemoperoxidus ATCC BAA-382]EOT60135.1 hypothetical protein I583_02770 [Enterococcus haemoperoxidus ATCC BAA-382]
MKKNRYVYLLFFLGLVLFTFPNQSHADEQSNLGYTVSAVRSAKQIDPEKTYFYLQTKPGEEEQLKVRVKSTQKEAVNLKIYVTDAYTGDSGTIEYTEDEKLFDSTLKAPISSMVQVETPSMKIENFEEKEATFKLTPPKDSYPGIKMGALVFELDNPEEKERVKTKFSYRVGLFTSESGDDYKDSKTLNLLDVKSTLKRGKKMVLASLQNPEPKVLSNLSVTAEVTEKGKQNVLKKIKVENYMLAPNSHFDFEMDWGTAAVRAGTYIVKMNANNSYNDWNFEKEFIISGEQAKKMNEDSGFKIITPNWMKLVAVLLLITTFVITGVLLNRRKKMEIQWKKYKKRKKRKKKKEGQ